MELLGFPTGARVLDVRKAESESDSETQRAACSVGGKVLCSADGALSRSPG